MYFEADTLWGLFDDALRSSFIGCRMPNLPSNSLRGQRNTARAVAIIQAAEELAQLERNELPTTVDLLRALLVERAGLPWLVLDRLGVTAQKLQAENAGFVTEDTVSVDCLLKRAELEMARLHHTYIGTEHLLLALTAFPDSHAVRTLMQLGIDPLVIRREVYDILGHLDEDAGVAP